MAVQFWQKFSRWQLAHLAMRCFENQAAEFSARYMQPGTADLLTQDGQLMGAHHGRVTGQIFLQPGVTGTQHGFIVPEFWKYLQNNFLGLWDSPWCLSSDDAVVTQQTPHQFP